MTGGGVGATILVVEDTTYSLQLMTYLLTAHQHTVVEAVTGEQAIELASATGPDLVVMDLQLPGIDGFETMAAVRAIPDRDAVPVIAVSSFAMVGDRDRALDAGFDHYLTKPIDPESFVEEINTWLPEQLRGRIRPQPGAQPASAAGSLPEPEPEPGGDRGADILVLDASRLNQMLLRSILEPHGYRVRTTSTVEEAIAAADAARPDLVLSEVHVGRRSGAELLAHLSSAVPFAFLSATVDWQDPLLGADAPPLIRAPIEPMALLAEVHALLHTERGTGRCQSS
jgi:two-component system cell cycle response regulator